MQEDEAGGARPGDLDFQTWVAPFVPAMSRYASRIVNPVDRDDVVQESLVRAWSRWSTFDPDRGTPVAWLLAIVRDRGRRHRSRARSHHAVAVSEDAQWMTPADLDLERAIARLSPRQRQVVDLYYFVDLDVTTIAQLMRCAPGTVKATLSQARTRLRDILGEHDD